MIKTQGNTPRRHGALKCTEGLAANWKDVIEAVEKARADSSPRSSAAFVIWVYQDSNPSDRRTAEAIFSAAVAEIEGRA